MIVNALLSLHPRFSQAVFAGDKTIELRKVPMKLKPGDRITIYETAPTKAIAGYAQVREVFSYPAKNNFRFTEEECTLLWEKAKHGCCIEEEEFQSYYRTARHCFMIFLEAVTRYPQISLQKMREQGINPPQCVQYLSEAQMSALISSNDARFL